MGRFKEQMICDEMMGYALPPDKQVCAKMFLHQEYIRERIERDGEDGVCSYSGKKRESSAIVNHSRYGSERIL